ncbi:hypothetical protein Tco_1392875 [Tanacetum coccineum]
MPVFGLSLISPRIRNLMRGNVCLAKNGVDDKTSRKQRICWSLEFNKRFVNALQQLGGSEGRDKDHLDDAKRDGRIDFIYQGGDMRLHAYELTQERAEGKRKGWREERAHVMALFAATAIGTNDSTMVDELLKWIAKRWICIMTGITADAQRATSDSLKRKLKPDADSYVFERYSHLCERNVSPRYSPNLPQAIDARAVAAATAVSVKGALPALSSFGRDRCGNTSGSWIAGAVALPAAGPKGTCSSDGARIHCYQVRRCAKRTENEPSSSELAARDTKASAKRPLFSQPSFEAKKKKGGYTRGRKNIKCYPFVNNILAYHLTKCASDVEQRKILNSAAKRGLQTSLSV